MVQAGLQATGDRYRELGLHLLLPPERTWIGIATDREAQAIARRTAMLANIAQPAAGLGLAAYLDSTGRLASTSPTRVFARVDRTRTDSVAFLARMAVYHCSVTTAYETFLAERSPSRPDSLHDAIITATITGSLVSLSRLLNRDHGPAAFTRLFRATEYTRRATAA